MDQRVKVSKTRFFDPTQSEGQIPFTGNIHSDLWIFTLMNMDISEGRECLEVLQRNNLLEPFENTYSLLKDISGNSPTDHPRKIAELAPCLFTCVVIHMDSISPSKEKRKLEETAVKMSKAMLMAFVNGNRKYAKDILERIADVIETNCKQFNIDRKLIIQRFENELSDFPEWVQSNGVNNNKLNSVPANTDTGSRFIWNDKSNLAELVHRLKKNRLISRKKDFFDLFEAPANMVVVEWDENRIALLARLIYELFNKSYCFMRGSKGYFAYAEQRFTMGKKSIRPGRLRKLSSKINNNPDKFLDVIKEVDDLLRDV